MLPLPFAFSGYFLFSSTRTVAACLASCVTRSSPSYFALSVAAAAGTPAPARCGSFAIHQKTFVLGCFHRNERNFPVETTIVQCFGDRGRLVKLGPKLVVPRSFTVIEHLSDVVGHMLYLWSNGNATPSRL
jgi:hypothetical protein